MKDIVHQLLKKPLLAIAILLALLLGLSVLIKTGITSVNLTLNYFPGSQLTQTSERPDAASAPPSGAGQPKGGSLADYGYRVVAERSFFTERKAGYGYAASANQITAADLKRLGEGYDLWTYFQYEFANITEAQLRDIRVRYLIVSPDGTSQKHDGGRLGDGTHAEYDRGDMPSLLTSYFAGGASHPLGVYQLQLYFNEELAGVSKIELVSDSEGRHIDIPEYELAWNTGDARYRASERSVVLHNTLGGEGGERVPGGTSVKVLSDPIVYQGRIWYEVEHSGATRYAAAQDL